MPARSRIRRRNVRLALRRNGLGSVESLGRGVRIVLPFARYTDADVITLGVRLGVPIHLTWTCYRDGARPCRRCSACRGRIESFRHSGMEDPS